MLRDGLRAEWEWLRGCPEPLDDDVLLIARVAPIGSVCSTRGRWGACAVDRIFELPRTRPWHPAHGR